MIEMLLLFRVVVKLNGEVTHRFRVAADTEDHAKDKVREYLQTHTSVKHLYLLGYYEYSAYRKMEDGNTVSVLV